MISDYFVRWSLLIRRTLWWWNFNITGRNIIYPWILVISIIIVDLVYSDKADMSGNRCQNRDAGEDARGICLRYSLYCLIFSRWILLENLHMTKQSYVVVNIDNKKESFLPKWVSCCYIFKDKNVVSDNYYSPTVEQSRQQQFNSNKGKN